MRMNEGGKRLLKYAALLLLAVISAGCATGGDASMKKLRVGTPTAVGVGTSPMVAAIELGYFAEEGIKVVHTSYPTTVPIMEDVVAKKVDVGGGGIFPLVVANQPGKDQMPIRFFYNLIRNFGFHIVVLPSSPLNSIADLKGKKLGVYQVKAPYAPVTRAILKEHGLSEDDVELVPLGTKLDGFELLERGEIDAYQTAGSAGYEATGKKLKRLPQGDRVNNLMTYSYFAHMDFIEAEPDMLIGFGRAMSKGILTCSTNPEWCVKILWKYYPHLNPAPEAMDKEMAREIYVLQKYLERCLAFAPGEPRLVGGYPSDAFPALIDVLFDGGELASKDLDMKDIYTDEYIGEMNNFDVEAVEARARKLK